MESTLFQELENNWLKYLDLSRHLYAISCHQSSSYLITMCLNKLGITINHLWNEQNNQLIDQISSSPEDLRILIFDLLVQLFRNDQTLIQNGKKKASNDYGLCDFLHHQLIIPINPHDKHFIAINLAPSTLTLDELGQTIGMKPNWMVSTKIFPNMPVIDGTSERYNCSNPSIIKYQDQYLICCRGVSYIQEYAASFRSRCPDRIIRTENMLLQLPKLPCDSDMSHQLSDRNSDTIIGNASGRNSKVIAKEWLLLDRSNRKTYPGRVLGHEDVQIFEYRNQVWFLCTTADSLPQFLPQMAIAKLSSNLVEIISFTLINGPIPGRCEKNWLPIVWNDQVMVVYSYNPLTLYQINFDSDGQPTGTMTQISSSFPFSRFGQGSSLFNSGPFRGSGRPVRFVIDDQPGYLMVVHEVSGYSKGRHYNHRFIWMNDQFILTKKSRLFNFMHLGIEFCRGLCMSKDEHTVIISAGIEDSNAYLFYVPADLVCKLLI